MTSWCSTQGRRLSRGETWPGTSVWRCAWTTTGPFAFVLLQGRAELSEDLDEVRTWAGLIGARYMGEERAEEFATRNGVPGELVVRVHVDKVVAYDAVAE